MRTRRHSFLKSSTIFMSVVLLGSSVTGVSWADSPLDVTPASSAASCRYQSEEASSYAVVKPVPQAQKLGSAVPYTPKDLRSAYLIPCSSTTATVAIVVAYGAPSLQADLGVYRRFYDLPPCTIASGCLRIVDQYGGRPLPASPADAAGWVDETELDVEMVSAICPTCHILVVQAVSAYGNDLAAAVEQAVTQGAKYVSMSWGASDTGQDWLTLRPGIVYVAASGDSGYGTSYPASDSRVVSVGGTSLVRDHSARGWVDTAWNSSSGATGGGCSASAMPTWQQEIPDLRTVCTQRSQNDLAILGDPDTGVSVYDQGAWVQAGGTSAGSPMVAAMFALTGQQLGDNTVAPEILYANSKDFIDVTEGSNARCSNLLCKAVTGYDAPTGLGVPQGIGAFVASGSSEVSVQLGAIPTSYVGQRVSMRLSTTTRSVQPLTYYATGLPAGITLSTGGVASGVARKAGTYTVRMMAVGTSGAKGSAVFRWTVKKPGAIVPARRPSITGKLVAGHVVLAYWGSLRAAAAKGAVIHPTVRVQWYVNWHKVKGATKTSFRLPKLGRVYQVSYRVTAAATGFSRYQYLTPRRNVRSAAVTPP